jgi:GAF domain-containing protein
MRHALAGIGAYPSDPHLAASLQATTDNVKDWLPDCLGLSISLVRNGYLTYTFVRTDTLTGVLDAMQYFDDGPCEAAVRSGEEVRIDDVLSDDHWPLFAQISAAAGIYSSLSIPLRRGPTLVGSVNVYGDTTHAFTGKEEELADAFGVHVQAMISQADLSQSPQPRPDVHPDPVAQAIIDEALDVLVATHGFARSTVGRRLDEAAARARILSISAARAILLGQPELTLR